MQAYDYIVIGAGSAGCAVAGRLASESSASVLLIEAGGSDKKLRIRAPMLFATQFGSSLDWGYETEPEPGCGGRRIAMPRGRALGGTSGMNAMVWVRGSDLDYDDWGLPGWKWQDVAPVFERIESGPMRIGRVPCVDEISRRVVAAARNAGVPARDDVSGPELDGVAISPVTIHDGQRWNTARAYLVGQPNLTVLSKVLVNRVLVRQGRAVGVEYARGRTVERAFADHEVVLSAGAFGSPQLLQLSGIGPAEHLKSVGITPDVDSPRVGTGLTDHPNPFAVFELAPGFTGMSDALHPKHLAQWLIRHEGKLSSNVIESVAHIRTEPGLPACDMQLIFMPMDVTAKTLRFKPAVSAALSYWTPKSRGSVLVRSADPTTAPAIRLNLLSERADVDALIRGVERVRQIMATEPIAAAIDRESTPGPVDVEQSIRDTCITTSHPACSVAMGGEDSPLDERLRVRGVERLRVADASALPVIPRANTNAPAIMIGERCADFLLEDAG